jgi:hypothetical protein
LRCLLSHGFGLSDLSNQLLAIGHSLFALKLDVYRFVSPKFFAAAARPSQPIAKG